MKDDTINLKLSCKSLDDLQVVSAHLQDSIVLIKDIIFLKKNKFFLMMLKRFMWEDIEKGLLRKNKRIKCVVRFGSVQKAIAKKINQHKANTALNFLTIEAYLLKNNIYKISFIFAGDSKISIFCEEIECYLEDRGKFWTVKKAPKHKI